MSSLYLPLVQSRRPVRLHDDFKAQPCRCHWLEGVFVVAVFFDAVRTGIFHRLPLIAVFVEQAPGLRKPHLAAFLVVKPVTLTLRECWRVIHSITDTMG